jgi:acyl carrier protein
MNREEMFDVLKANICEVLPGAVGKEILESNNTADFGGDSLEAVEVVSRTMKQLRIKVPRTELLEARIFGDVLDLFEKAAARAK